MERYTTPGTSQRGISPYEWIKQYAAKSNLQYALIGKPSSARGTGVNIVIIGVEPLVKAFRGRFGLDHTSLAKQGHVLIPFGNYTASREDNVVMQQAARDFVTLGKNSGGMSNENVVTAYFSALQNLAFAIASSLSKKEQADIADTFFALVDTFKQFSQKHSDVCEKLASAMIKDDSAADSLQKAIAMGYFPEMANKTDWLRLLETVFKRHAKWSARERTPLSLLGAIPGPIAVLLLAPLIKNASALSVYREAEKALLVTMVQVATDASLSSSKKDLVIFDALLKYCPFIDLSPEIQGLFLEFCWVRKNAGIPAPLEVWGLVKIAKPSFPIGTEINQKGRSCNPVITVNDDGSISARGQNYQHWSGIQLPTPGNYTATVVMSGIASAGKGNNAKNTANIRFTTGNNVLDYSKVAGNNCKSSAGKLQTDGKFSDSDRLDFSGPIRIIVTAAEFRVYHKNGQRWFKTPRNGKPVLIGFKTCTITISKEEDDIQGNEAAPVLDAATAATRMEDLTPHALMMQLRGLAMKESYK